ncbi:hypothetical protein T484DRAFT_1983397 [Baffinella frigidus]|nr:hypothetical protein T484DRAFT_1983397 [Cryptophyta sp. CCMP2293]
MAKRLKIHCQPSAENAAQKGSFPAMAGPAMSGQPDLITCVTARLASASIAMRPLICSALLVTPSSKGE